MTAVCDKAFSKTGGILFFQSALLPTRIYKRKSK